METTMEFLRKDALTTTYEDVELLIYDTVWGFINVHGGDFEEFVAQANLYYIIAYDLFEEKEGVKFSTWVVWCIKKGLLNLKAFLLESNKYSQKQYLDDFIYEERSVDASTLFELVESIGEDSKLLIKMILDPPTAFAHTIKDKGTYSFQCRVALKKYLGTLGWTAARIKESFEEIRQVLYE